MRIEKQHSGGADGQSTNKNSINSGAVSQANKSNQGDDSHSMEPLSNPRYKKMQSAAPMLEAYSASKKPVHSKFRADIVQLEQEYSQSQTLGQTPSQPNRTPPPERSSAKRRKISDHDPFVSHEKLQVDLVTSHFNRAAVGVKAQVPSRQSGG